MLPKQLKAIKKHLDDLKIQKTSLTKEQKRLLHELDFLNNSELVELALSEYRYEELKLESFAVASGLCPNCGKKY